jgi:hypothetical protein
MVKTPETEPAWFPWMEFVMRSNVVHSETSAPGVYSHDGLRALHEAAADVEEGLEFWKTIAGNIPSQRRVSREFLNRQG